MAHNWVPLAILWLIAIAFIAANMRAAPKAHSLAVIIGFFALGIVTFALPISRVYATPVVLSALIVAILAVRDIVNSLRASEINGRWHW